MQNTNQLALAGGRPVVDRSRPVWPVVGELEASWMDAVVRSGKWSWAGPHEQAFCQEFAGFIGAGHCAALSNGTVTLQCALQAVGVKPGDEVIVPGLTWVATAQAALDIGADVVLVDIDPDTYCLDVAAVEAAITERTRAVIPVHLYGCMVDMDALQDLAAKHDLKIVEDVAHQHGSRWRNVGAGVLGDAGSFSFQQSKVLTCGEGGAVTTNDESVYETVFALKQVGWSSDLKTPGNRYGHNYRITEMQAVLLRGGLTRIHDQLRVREENVGRLTEGLEKIDGCIMPAARDPRVTRQSYYAMTLHFEPDKAEGLERDKVLKALAAEGCGLSTPYPPVYRSGLLNLYDDTSPVPFRDASRIQNYAQLELPNVERVCNQRGALLMHYALLGDSAYIKQLLEAFQKVQDNLPRVAEYYRQQQTENS